MLIQNAASIRDFLIDNFVTIPGPNIAATVYVAYNIANNVKPKSAKPAFD